MRSSNSARYVVGTKLQMKKSGTSHKRNSCKYHDVTLVKEGEYIKTMNQVETSILLKIVVLVCIRSHLA